MRKPPKQNAKPSKQRRRRSRYEKPLKIDDSPRNIARALFGIRSDKFAPRQE